MRKAYTLSELSNFGVLVATVTVLHMLIFPSDLEMQNAPSVHLRSVIAIALDSPKEYNGLHHIFITTFGRISYAPVPDMQHWSRAQVTTLRCKLEIVVKRRKLEAESIHIRSGSRFAE